MGDGVADAGLCGEVHDYLGLVLRENVVDKRLIREVALDEDVFNRAGCGDFFNFGKAVFLQADIVIVVHAVKADEVTGGDVAHKAHDEICADETGGAGDEDCFI